MGRDEFLKLLMAQIEFQDPMSPVQNHEFVAQLATFSSLEQQMLSNQQLEALQLGQLSASNAQLTGFLGENITARGDTTRLDGTNTPPLGIELSAPAESVKVTIKDASGKVVHTLDREQLAAGVHQIPWSGKDANGAPLPAGEYTVQIEALDENGEPVESSNLVTGVVTGVSFDLGYPELVVGERRVRPADVLSVGNPGSSSST
jgi:flagellar basal-body rod modification protein FlgD